MQLNMEEGENMKKLVIISGAPGIGKTTLCRELLKSIEGCAWLDSDWCWMINPWKDKTQEQKKYVEGTFTRILRGYLDNENIKTILFSWVISSEYMFDLVIKPLSDMEFDLVKIALVCDREVHIERMRKDNRREEQINSPYSMAPFYKLGAEVIDVTQLSVDEMVKSAIHIINKEKGKVI